MERRDLEVKFQTASAGLVSGYASVFGGKPDSYGDVIAPGAYAASLKAHREAGPSESAQHPSLELRVTTLEAEIVELKAILARHGLS